MGNMVREHIAAAAVSAGGSRPAGNTHTYALTQPTRTPTPTRTLTQLSLGPPCEHNIVYAYHLLVGLSSRMQWSEKQ